MTTSKVVTRQPNQPEGDYLRLNLRSRVQAFKAVDEWLEIQVPIQIPVNRAALLLCDVWDDHCCSAAARRLNEMVPRIDQTVRSLRERGLPIVHAPSDTMDFYEGTPQRERTRQLSRVEPPPPLDLPNVPLPVDAGDDGCDSDDPPCERAWTRQHAGIEIFPEDYISDQGLEVYALLAERGIDHLIIAGVHTNFCILNRSFAIKQMTRWGVRCILVRDLTDALCAPHNPPYVDHDTGTQLVIEFIEKRWCPTVLSAELIAHPS